MKRNNKIYSKLIVRRPFSRIEYRLLSILMMLLLLLMLLRLLMYLCRLYDHLRFCEAVILCVEFTRCLSQWFPFFILRTASHFCVYFFCFFFVCSCVPFSLKSHKTHTSREKIFSRDIHTKFFITQVCLQRLTVRISSDAFSGMFEIFLFYLCTQKHSSYRTTDARLRKSHRACLGRRCQIVGRGISPHLTRDLPLHVQAACTCALWPEALSVHVHAMVDLASDDGKSHVPRSSISGLRTRIKKSNLKSQLTVRFGHEHFRTLEQISQ